MQRLVGMLTRRTNKYSIQLNASPGQRLQILVENQGRSYFTLTPSSNKKGILGGVTYGGATLVNWTMTSFPFEDFDKLVESGMEDVPETNSKTAADCLSAGPTFFVGTVYITEGKDIWDTYLDPSGWGKVCHDYHCCNAPNAF